MSDRIAVIGMACRYPDASTPTELWHNVLAGRRAFRRIPDERMRQADYYSPDPTVPDRFYAPNAAVIEGWEFDRVAYRIAGSTFRATDTTHWLTLDTVAHALRDAGFPNGDGLDRQNTGVIIGNTLTGEFARANLLRLRWPYVRRVVGVTLREQGWTDSQLTSFLDQLETRYKQPFPKVDEDFLAGGMSNTIAGRVCNYFDFAGGGFTVDAACSSSVLSVATACDALLAGTITTAVAGGVDLSIDPFEVIGFAKTGALSTSEMRIYDRDSNGFWPGEGCGVLVLMRDEDAKAKGLKRYATIAGWGYSSDGKGGITRPEASGHHLALTRAYAKAGFGIDKVSYVEGHGTGTAVGDDTELRVFTEARRAADPNSRALAIGTIKGNIGHTKAAAGVAGILKTIMALHHKVIPPATGHTKPHPRLKGDNPAVRVPDSAEPWPTDGPPRAGISSLGFGGINTHMVLEHADAASEPTNGHSPAQIVRSRQDAELLLFDATSIAELRTKLKQASDLAFRMSFAEVADLAATLAGGLDGRPIRAAVLASAPEQVRQRIETILSMLGSGVRAMLDIPNGVFLGTAATQPRIGLLFPGQGVGGNGDGGAIRRRFDVVDELYRTHKPPVAGGDLSATVVAQPRIVTASVSGLRILDALGIEAVGATGQSLGELAALHWGGAIDEATVLNIATARGKALGQIDKGDGTMAAILAAPEDVTALLDGEPVVISGYNSPQQTVVSGPVAAIERVCARAGEHGLTATRFPVSQAFHSDLVAPATTLLRTHLQQETFRPLARTVISTVTAEPLDTGTDLVELLTRHIIAPVRLTEAVRQLADDVDLLVDVGPGRVVGRLAEEIAPFVSVVSMETDSPSLSGLLRTVGAAWVLGAQVRTEVLFDGRFTKPLPLDKEFKFFVSPAELAPILDGTSSVAEAVSLGNGNGNGGAAGLQPVAAPAPAPAVAPAGAGGPAPAPAPAQAPAVASGANIAESSLDILRRLAAERAELPLEAVRPDSLPLDELHLSSITVGQIVTQASRDLGLPPPVTTSAFATSTLAELAAALVQASEAPQQELEERVVAGVAPWVRAFKMDMVPTKVGAATEETTSGEWQLFSVDGHPFATELCAALSGAKLGNGVVLCVPADPEAHVGAMLDAARAAVAQAGPARFVVVGDRKGASGLAKTLHLEAPTVKTTVVTLPLAQHPADVVSRIVADVAATQDFSEVHYDESGTRLVPVLRPLTLAPAQDYEPLGKNDVLLATGGGKGITAECALALAKESGASVALLERSELTDPELAENLRRFKAAGVRCHYVRADVTVAEQVRAAMAEVRTVLGPVTAVLHGAGRNEPKPITSLDEESFRATLAPKVSGLGIVLAEVDPAGLRLLITFGSIIGRAGMHGNADYSTANDWMTDLTVRTGELHPACRSIALEWSVWTGVGMGEKLGAVESLVRQGVSPISTENGIRLLSEVLNDPQASGALVVMGRAENLPTITQEARELPLLRFVDRPQVQFPGVELVVDADLSADDDPYLRDHTLDGNLIFPAVLGMEAMAQAATALTGRHDVPVFEDVELLRPIVVPDSGKATIRIAVLADSDAVIRAVIRTADTDFQADHFRATLRYDRAALAGDPVTPESPLLPIDPASQLYGSVLFQSGRFGQLRGYRHLAATSCVAEVATARNEQWFSRFLSGELVLADPGARDATMHGIQCCVPDATLLPVGIEALHLADPVAVRDVDLIRVHATERWTDGDTYIYDVDVRDTAGNLVEHWQGLKLQAIRKADGSGPWLPALLTPYLERRTQPVLSTPLKLAVRPDDPGTDKGVDGRRDQTTKAVSWALDRQVEVTHRPDGRPETQGAQISASHSAGVTFAVADTENRVACDIEVAETRSADDWAALLGPDQLALAKLVAQERGEELSVAATRVWGAVESLRKLGRARIDGLTAGPARTDRWVQFRFGDIRIATFVTALRDVADPVVFTIVTGSED
nr:type I polyketide synthase [Kibdelosporangium sp. MJ126-NF4]CEL14216.1 Malonyl CoA-acyl carrier protein transacylase [Kibdelosporangium sp. MJ126-NF4]CTQ88584.1 Malonyl CoA-acyl carrier protein transacylase (EC 2.3.1.39) [Kibdelosporangium sp. MJ126-NF4]